MNRVIDSLAGRLRAARQARGLTQEALAERSDMKQPDVSKLEKGLMQQTTGIARLAAALGVSPAWLELGIGPDPDWDNPSPPTERGVAQSLSLSPFETPPVITWETVMRQQPLPAFFRLAIPDDATGPEYPRGLELVWSTGKTPQIGSLVLVRDGHGRAHVRQYRQGRSPDRWIAGAASAAFADFDSVDDSITVVAVAQWRPMP